MLVQLPDANAAKRWAGADRTIRALVFEPAGVLYDATARRRWLWQLVTRLGPRRTYDEFIGPWDRNYLPAAQRGEIPYADALCQFLGTQGLSAAHRDEVVAAMSLRRQPLEAGLRPMPGVVRMLSRFSAAGYTLAVLSDSVLSGEQLKAQLDSMGIGGQLVVVITSCDLRSTKPDARNYAAISAALGIPTTESAFVSSRSEDLRGAMGCGWNTIHFGALDDPDADISVNSPMELLNAVFASANTDRHAAG